MFKKGITAILIISLVFVMNIMSFSENDNAYVNIINPEVGESGKIISDNSLFFSIFVMQDVELTLDLVKTDTPVFVFEEALESPKEALESPKAEIESTNDVEEIVEEEKVLASSIDDTEQEYDVEFLIEAPKVLSKESISRSYQQAQDDYKQAKKDYYNALDRVKSIPDTLNELVENFDPIYELTEEDLFNLENINVTFEIYNDSIIEHNYWEDEYFALFENKILSNIDIDVDALLPYFEYTVKDIEEGTYKLIIKLKETDEVVELLEFEVVTEKSLVDEIFEDVFSHIDFFDVIIESEEIE